MSINLQHYYAQIRSVIEQYGIQVTVMRDTFTNECGVKKRNDTGVQVATIDMVLDNSSRAVNEQHQSIPGIGKPLIDATMYYIYDDSVELRSGDYFVHEGIRYVLQIPKNLVNANLVYQVTVRGEYEHGLQP